MQEETVQPQPEPKSLEALLAEAQAKIEQQRDTMMRAVADAENARKRAQPLVTWAMSILKSRWTAKLRRRRWMRCSTRWTSRSAIVRRCRHSL